MWLTSIYCTYEPLDTKSGKPIAASPGAIGATPATSTSTATNSAESSDNPVDSLHYGAFLAQIIVISLVGLVLLAVVWRRKQRSWYAIPGDSTLGTPKEEDFNTDNDDDMEDEDDGDENDLPPNSTTSTTAVRSPPRRKVPTPRFTIGSDDEDDRHYGDEDNGENVANGKKPESENADEEV